VETAVDKRPLFVHIPGVSGAKALGKAEPVLPRGAIIHKGVENVLIPCESRVLMSSPRELSFPDDNL